MKKKKCGTVKITPVWVRVINVMAEEVARAKKAAYFAKLNKWGNEVVEELNGNR